MIPILCGVFMRLGGTGTNDNFLPIWPFNKFHCKIANKWWRWLGIGLVISYFTGKWWYIPSYYLATNISYSDSNWLSQFPLGREFNFLVYGFFFGLASFSWGNAVFCGMLFFVLMELSKFDRLHHGWVEFLFGGLGTGIFLWK